MNVDGQGRFSINALAQGVPYDLNVTALGYGLNNIQIPASDTKTTQFELPTVVLKIANRQVSGQVLGPDGKPCWGARITVIGDGQPASSPGGGASSDAGGHFVVRQICDGPLVVRAMLPASVTNPQYLVSTVEARGGDTNVVLYLRKP
jgi:hypothetical protein